MNWSKQPPSRSKTLTRLALVGLLGLLGLPGMAQAQAIEDHSLPGSVVKTYHVKCASGRLGMLRYDTRKSPVRLCASVQDGSRPQRCSDVAAQGLAAELNAGRN